MRAILALLALAISCGPAFASGGLSCEAKEKDVSFQVSGGVTRGMGAPLFGFNGAIQVNDKKVAKDLAKTPLTQDHVAQYWLDGEELRLRLYRERDSGKPHGYVELGIETKARSDDDDEGSYDGRYFLTVFDMVDDNASEGLTVVKKGKVTCSVE